MNGNSSVHYQNQGYHHNPDYQRNHQSPHSNPQPDKIPMRRYKTGHDNRAYVSSTIESSDRSPSPNNNSNHIDSPSNRYISHDPSRYSDVVDHSTPENQNGGSTCSKKRCCCAVGIIAALLVIGVAIFLAVYFGKWHIYVILSVSSIFLISA